MEIQKRMIGWTSLLDFTNVNLFVETRIYSCPVSNQFASLTNKLVDLANPFVSPTNLFCNLCLKQFIL